jgi:hypothetical protein
VRGQDRLSTRAFLIGKRLEKVGLYVKETVYTPIISGTGTALCPNENTAYTVRYR